MKKEYKVIGILDKKKIIINYGSKDNASKKDIIRIIDKGPEVIYDGKSYGSYDNVKAELKINEMYPEFSVCSNTITTSKNSAINSLTQRINNMNNMMYQKQVELDVNEYDIKNLEKPKDSPISLGDLVEITRFIGWQIFSFTL